MKKEQEIIKTKKAEKKTITNKEAEAAIKKNRKKAEELLANEDKLEKFLLKLERKLKVIPKLGDKLAIIPTFISLVRSYVKKEYTEIPLGTILAILGALIYFMTPIDIISDAIPVLGYSDDVAIILVCLKLVGDDVKEYEEWRETKKANKNTD